MFMFPSALNRIRFTNSSEKNVFYHAPIFHMVDLIRSSSNRRHTAAISKVLNMVILDNYFSYPCSPIARFLGFRGPGFKTAANSMKKFHSYNWHFQLWPECGEMITYLLHSKPPLSLSFCAFPLYFFLPGPLFTRKTLKKDTVLLV